VSIRGCDPCPLSSPHVYPPVVRYARFRSCLDPFLLRPDVWPSTVGALVDAAVEPGQRGHNQPWFVLASLTNVMVSSVLAPAPGSAVVAGTAEPGVVVVEDAGRWGGWGI
jgi:hypothetical protein